MKKFAALVGLAALAFSQPTLAATVIPVGTTSAAGSFTIQYATPDDSLVDATFVGNILGKNKAFDYDFTFTLPLSGIGSGSLSTSFSGKLNAIDITQVLVDGVDETNLLTTSTGGQSLVLANFPIDTLHLNTIEVIGVTGPKAIAASFSGTATFTAVPEPATWALSLLGFAVIGLGLRSGKRRQAAA